MRLRIPEVLFGALLAVAIFSIGVTFALQMRTAQEFHEVSKTEASKFGAEERVADYTLWLAWLTGVLAVSTTGLWAVTYFTLRHGRETAERQLRAYVSVSEVRVEHLEGMAEFSVELKNCGQTPAYKLTVDTNVKLAAHPLNEPLALTARPRGVTIVGPGQASHGFVPAGRALNAEELAALRAGTKALYVFGEINYEDAFGIARWTRFRFMIGGDVDIRPEGFMGACLEGNEAI